MQFLCHILDDSLAYCLDCYCHHAHTHCRFHALSHSTWASWVSHVELCSTLFTVLSFGRLLFTCIHTFIHCHFDRLHIHTIFSFAYASCGPSTSTLFLRLFRWLMPSILISLLCSMVPHWAIMISWIYGATWGQSVVVTFSCSMLYSFMMYGATMAKDGFTKKCQTADSNQRPFDLKSSM